MCLIIIVCCDISKKVESQQDGDEETDHNDEDTNEDANANGIGGNNDLDRDDKDKDDDAGDRDGIDGNVLNVDGELNSNINDDKENNDEQIKEGYEFIHSLYIFCINTFDGYIVRVLVVIKGEGLKMMKLLIHLNIKKEKDRKIQEKKRINH